VLTRGDIDVLRPATPGSLRPADLDAVIGQVIASPLVRGQALERSLLKG
jgi:flagella basal body P-ring formation protein FlgA